MLGIVEPAVIVCRDGDRAVAELRLAGKKGFRYVGHADQVRTTIAQEEAFGAGSESRSFDDGVGLALVKGQLQRTRGARHEADGALLLPGLIAGIDRIWSESTHGAHGFRAQFAG